MIPFWKDTVTPLLSIVVDGVLYTEEWKAVEGYEGLYQISSFGRVKSLGRMKKGSRGSFFLKGRILRAGISAKLGYPLLSLYPFEKKHTQFYVHRLVASAFVSNPMSLPWVNHIDGDKANPLFLNLEWSDVSENGLHAFRTGLNKKVGKTGKENKKSIQVAQCDMQGNVVKVWDALSEAGRNGFNPSLIAAACRGKRTHHKGFLWKYIPH